MGDNSWATEMAEFYENIKLDRSPSTSLKDAEAVLKIIEFKCHVVFLVVVLLLFLLLSHQLDLNKHLIKPISIKFEKDQSVGIIGAGPARLAAAEQLRKDGYKITVYDRYDRAGGLLIYGIPNFKLEKFVVERRTELLKKS